MRRKAIRFGMAATLALLPWILGNALDMDSHPLVQEALMIPWLPGVMLLYGLASFTKLPQVLLPDSMLWVYLQNNDWPDLMVGFLSALVTWFALLKALEAIVQSWRSLWSINVLGWLGLFIVLYGAGGFILYVFIKTY